MFCLVYSTPMINNWNKHLYKSKTYVSNKQNTQQLSKQKAKNKCAGIPGQARNKRIWIHQVFFNNIVKKTLKKKKILKLNEVERKKKAGVKEIFVKLPE